MIFVMFSLVFLFPVNVCFVSFIRLNGVIAESLHLILFCVEFDDNVNVTRWNFFLSFLIATLCASSHFSSYLCHSVSPSLSSFCFTIVFLWHILCLSADDKEKKYRDLMKELGM